MRIVSYNIRGGLGMDGVRDTARIADVVRPLNADVICFQEVHQRLPWSGWIDQSKLLTQALGGQVVFLRCINTLLGGYGLAVWTRLPVVGVRRHFLPGGRERRGALQVSISHNGTAAAVFCTHFGLAWDERTAQAARLAELVNNADGPCVVCGDFNDTHHAPYMEQFLTQTGLADCGAGGDLPTYPADAPDVRIDFVLSRGVSGVVQTVPTLASDHLPLWADLV